MNTYRITVAYDGTAYRGWQRQENTELTIQGILERRISEIAGKKTVVSGSGRTDSGVHALGQECSLYLEQEIDMDSFKKQLNALLPEDIRVLDISREKRDFHARKSAVGKCYEYQIDLRDCRRSPAHTRTSVSLSPFVRRSFWCSRIIPQYHTVCT